MEKKALITGITGFVGSHLRAELVAHGYDVYGIGTRAGGSENYRQADITNKDEMASVMRDILPTHIFHLAGISSLSACDADPKLAMRVNVTGAEHVLEAALGVSSTPRVLLVSSVHVYGEPAYLPIDESHPLRGTGVYAESRIAQEEVGKRYMDRLPIVITRSFNHTGPGQTDAFVIAKIMKQIVEIQRNRRAFLELGNTRVRRDLADVRDVVRAYRLLLEQDRMGVMTNVCSGVSVSLEEVIEEGRRLSGLPRVEVRVNPAFVRAHDVMDFYGDTRFLKQLILWKPEYALADTLRDLYIYWQEHMENV